MKGIDSESIICCSFSKNQKKILYSDDYCGNFQIYEYSIEHETSVCLVQSRVENLLANCFMLNDQVVIFQSDGGDEVNNIYSYDVNTRKQRKITDYQAGKVKFITKINESNIVFRYQQNYYLFNVNRFSVMDKLSVNRRISYLGYDITKKRWLYTMEDERSWIIPDFKIRPGKQEVPLRINIDSGYLITGKRAEDKAVEFYIKIRSCKF